MTAGCSTVNVVRVLVVGAAGMLGSKLAERLARDGAIAGAPVSNLALVDVVEPTSRADSSVHVETAVADIAVHGVAAELVSSRPDIVFHLAAVLSGEAEADLEKGYRV
jgi:Nucleoside-diphosphate-sugar epimerases